MPIIMRKLSIKGVNVSYVVKTSDTLHKHNAMCVGNNDHMTMCKLSIVSTEM